MKFSLKIFCYKKLNITSPWLFLGQYLKNTQKEILRGVLSLMEKSKNVLMLTIIMGYKKESDFPIVPKNATNVSLFISRS